MVTNTRTIPTEEEIERARTPGGGWTREQLAAWGVAWPPRRGWKKDLIRLAREIEHQQRDH